LKPCDENLATQIEEGYLKLKPFRTPATTTTTKVPNPLEDKVTRPPLQSPKLKPKDSPIETETKAPTPRSSSPFRFSRSGTPTPPVVETAKKEMIWKLLGDLHMGKYVVYTNATTAWLLSDDLYGKLTSSVYQTLSAGVHLGGAKLVRGYIELGKPKVQDKEGSQLKSSTLLSKVAGNEDAIADQAEEKEMEQDYDDSEKEDPNRYHPRGPDLMLDKLII
jgi:hypothetical protein